MKEKPKRIMLAVPAELNEKLAILAKLEGTTTAAFARKILTEYIDSRAAAVEEALKADATYQTSLEEIRGKYQ